MGKGTQHIIGPQQMLILSFLAGDGPKSTAMGVCRAWTPEPFTFSSVCKTGPEAQLGGHHGISDSDGSAWG